MLKPTRLKRPAWTNEKIWKTHRLSSTSDFVKYAKAIVIGWITINADGNPRATTSTFRVITGSGGMAVTNHVTVFHAKTPSTENRPI